MQTMRKEFEEFYDPALFDETEHESGLCFPFVFYQTDECFCVFAPDKASGDSYSIGCAVSFYDAYKLAQDFLKQQYLLHGCLPCRVDPYGIKINPDKREYLVMVYCS